MSLENGTIYEEKVSNKEPIRKDTGDKTQRPKAQTKKVKGDGGRGSFTDKC